MTPSRMAAASPSKVSAENGRRPASASYRDTEKLYWSEAAVARPPPKTSGAMYSGVPIISPVPVAARAGERPMGVASDGSPRERARPKSSTFTPAEPMRTLCGLKSRWTIPAAWAAARPRPAATNTSRTSRQVWRRAIQTASVSPSRCSMAMKTRRWCSPASNTVTTLG